MTNRQKYFTGIVFVSFQTRAMRESVLQQCRSQSSTFLKAFSKNKVYPLAVASELKTITGEMRRPANPLCIFWQNLYATPTERVKARICTHVATGVFVLVNLGVLLALKVIQRKISQKDLAEDRREGEAEILPNLRIRTVSVAMTIFIAVINAVIARFLRRLTLQERHTSASVFFRRVTLKLAVVCPVHQAQFINTNILVIVTHFVIVDPLNDSIFTNGALLSDTWFILLGQVSTTPLGYVLSPTLIQRIFERFVIVLKLKHNCAGKVTQAQANRTFEDPKLDPAFAYAAIVRNMFMVIFFQPLFPVTGILGVVCFFLLYWGQKYRFLRRTSRPVSITVKHAKTTNYLLSLAPLVYGVSSAH